MNEVTKIHLGRQAFTISVEAYHELKAYLEAIKKQVGDKEVVDEIELRMAELLTEHGLKNNKVVLPKDIDFLKEQLGNPTDFKEDDEENDSTLPQQNESKRLFRDTDDAMLAGVASGLAKYLGLDVLIIRILFIVITLITFGWGILLYVILWILVPEAKTSSDRLLMAGKPVTVDGLKEIVERADVKGAARRANATLATPINSIFRFILKLVGVVFTLIGLSVIFGLIAGETYLVLHSNAWSQDNIFPIGIREHIVLDLGVGVIALISLFITLFGIAMFRRKWPIRTWITGMLIGLILIGLAVGGGLAADVYPTVHARYNANLHTTVRSLSAFNTVTSTGDGVGINYQPSNKYYVALSYYGDPNLTNVKTAVSDGVLLIDSNEFNWHRNCQTLCIPDTYDLNITVYSPNTIQLQKQDDSMLDIPPVPTMKP